MASYEGSWSVPWNSYRRDITKVIFEENSNITNIGDNAFYDFSNLNNITIPDSVASIGNNAFDNCRSLSSIEIQNSVTKISVSAFYNCTGLTGITIPDGVTSIGEDAFGCWTIANTAKQK